MRNELANSKRSPSRDWDRVRVRLGMLEGLEGFITNRKKDRRLIVPITLTHQAISFEVDIELLERLEPEKLQWH